MRRLQDYLAPVGIAIILAALAWHRSGRSLPGDPIWWVLAGFAVVAVHVALRWDDLAGAVGGRQLRHGGNAFVLTILVVGILGAVNYLANRYNEKLDLTENQRYSLSDQTRKVVTGLEDDVTITYFGRPEDLARARPRLDDYAGYSQRLHVEYVDPVKDPVKLQSFGAQPPWPILFVDRGERRERLTTDSENDITNALLKVLRDVEKTVCFVQGEGERDIEDRSETGISAIVDTLKNQYSVKSVTLAREPAVPAECSVAVVAGPEYDLAPAVADALRDYVEGGGALLAMLEPPLEGPQPNLEGLLAGWNLVAGADIVIDVSVNRMLSGANEFTPIADAYNYHEITDDFRVATAFAMARTLKAGEGSIEGVTAQNLVQTSPDAWAETNLANLAEAEHDPDVDAAGPLTLAAVATVAVKKEPAGGEPPGSDEVDGEGDGDAEGDEGASEEPAAPERSGRVVAFGDSDFASNRMLAVRGNQDLFLNSVAWLAEDADLISIRPREPKDQRLFLTQLEQQNLALLALLLIPGLFVVGGVATWWNRR